MSTKSCFPTLSGLYFSRVAKLAAATYDHKTMLLGSLMFAAGLFTWTLVEYLIHGVLGHARRGFVAPMHNLHHRDPYAVFALGAWPPTAAVLTGGIAIFGLAPGIVLLCGLVTGFAGYEYLHYRIHFSAPASALEARLRARHLAHHFRRPGAIFGVTTPLWDVVFGTEPDFAEMRELAAAGARVAPLKDRSNLGSIVHGLSRRRIAAP